MKICLLLSVMFFCLSVDLTAQSIQLGQYQVVPVNVIVSKETLMGKEAVKIIKDPALAQADVPTYAKLNGTNFTDGTIEVKVLSRLAKDAPEFARGFIGLAFRINADNSKFESIYIRPTNGRADDQVRRNHSIQYMSFPDYKFDRLRKEAPEKYESYADMELNRWITLRIEVKGQQAKLFIDNNSQPSLIVNDLKLGPTASGAIGFWLDTGTEAYFSDFKVTN